MTTSLCVLSCATDDVAVHDVYWCCGKRKQGVVRCHVRSVDSDHALVAELAVLHHLLEVEEVCGSDRTGNGMELTVSHGAIRKLAAGRSGKSELAEYALFLRTRFSECKLVVSKSAEFISVPSAHSNPSELVVDGPPLSGIRFVDGSLVLVTHHALERYQQKFNVPSPGNAWRALRAAASHRSTRVEAANASDVAAQGKRARAYRSTNGCRMVVVNDTSGDRLVTVTYARSARVGSEAHSL